MSTKLGVAHFGFNESEWTKALRAMQPAASEDSQREFIQAFFGPHRDPGLGLNLSPNMLKALAENCTNGRERVQKALEDLLPEIRSLLADWETGGPD